MGSTTDCSVFDGSKWTTTKHGLRFCDGFQTGSCCGIASDGLHCGRDAGAVHQCNYCKRTGHGRSGCWALMSDQGAGGGGGGKPTGKGGKTKNGGKNGGKGGKNKNGGKGEQYNQQQYQQPQNWKKMPWNKW